VQLFDLYEFQRELAVPSKCGFEAREYVFGLWGGYFYCRSKEEAFDRYKEVKPWADSIDAQMSVVVKRYCTEFQWGPLSLGPTDKLPPQTEKELQEEKQIDYHLFKQNPQYDRVQPDFVQAHVMRRWIQWAYCYGDETYKEFTGGHSIGAQQVTYHHELNKKSSGAKAPVKENHHGRNHRK
jgi:hypothetical protein